ncbi:hypothetical protein BGW36DRAFT_294468 [Talaromyces proteolyticus]|uniref:AMP-dependent synthetase/ligase domain-containing protein n=1 Tax=Talaromyces proteolyticus TaxID=1131652 RepID=A0AAD4KY28_9EURO|nr:uncharacterized protein BGW36DRAFT_294468 [Talaromyces proteolyticus]KAH8699187.1 hypothetical protein BGW36DRAFT_294468 [Talaromyces proteolyticus]
MPSSSCRAQASDPLLNAKNYVQDLIPNIVDRHATENRDKVYASIPINNDDLSQGFRDITYREFNNAISKAAYWLEEKLGVPSTGSFPTFAYYGARDLRYAILLVAAMKVGYKMLSSSLLCTIDAHVHLVKESNCHTFLCNASTLPLVEKIEKAQPLSRHILVPDLLEFLPFHEVPNNDSLYPYNKTWDEACHEPCLIVHTSGSTGVPKVVVYTQYMLAAPDRSRVIPSYQNCQSMLWEMTGRRIFTSIPAFHLLGYAGFLVLPVYLDIIGIMAPPDKVITAEVADEIHRYARLDGGIYHPSLLEDVVRDEQKREEFRNFKIVFYSGSPLETITGDWLATTFGIVRNIVGSTEGFSWPALEIIDPTKDWNYTHFYPIKGLTFIPVGLDGAYGIDGELYELVVQRTAETEKFTNFFHAKPEAQEWRTKDLWKPHPDSAKPGHWLYQGRTDDLVVLSGEIKMYAGALEAKISAHPLMRSALVGGHQRKWPFLLLELVDQPADLAEAERVLDESIWAEVDVINTKTAHDSVRLRRSLVLVADARRPFVRLAKGSVARNPTFELYKEDIEKLYAVTEK